MKINILKNKTTLLTFFLMVVFFIYAFPALAHPTGDLNEDTNVNIADAQAAINVVLEMQDNTSIVEKTDLNGDGQKNITDVQLLINIILGTSNIQVCNLDVFKNNPDADAATAIQACLDNAPANSIVELPEGKYYISPNQNSNIKIRNKPLVLRSQGRYGLLPECNLEDDACAELVATADAYPDLALLWLDYPNSMADHLIINGNKINRVFSKAAKDCRYGTSPGGHAPGGNIFVSGQCTNCQVKNSVSKNTLCGSALGIEGPWGPDVNNRPVIIANNIVADSGFHGIPAMFSDGITFIDGNNSQIINNEIINSSDIDLVMGGCKNCTVADNIINHSGPYGSGSQAALVLHNWLKDYSPSAPRNTNYFSSGNYNGTRVFNNAIDCGPGKRCGFGLLIGSDAFYLSWPFGGTVYDNTIKNAQVGFSIDDAHDFTVYNNTVSNSGSKTITNCGYTEVTDYPADYSMGTESLKASSNNKSNDGSQITYPLKDWDGCVPNSDKIFWWPNVDYVTQDLYECILERTPDTSEKTAWNEYLVNGSLAIEDAFRQFFNSSEYLSKNNSNSKFITQMYNCVFYRIPDQSGLSSWTAALDDNSISRTAVLDVFLTSSEFIRNRPALQNILHN